jgi:hypothetical protein
MERCNPVRWRCTHSDREHCPLREMQEETFLATQLFSSNASSYSLVPMVHLTEMPKATEKWSLASPARNR